MNCRTFDNQKPHKGFHKIVIKMPRKKPPKIPLEFEDGRDRTKRLKKLRERRKLRIANETPQQHEARLQRLRQARKNRQIVRAAMAADKFVEEILNIKAVRPSTFEDHPAISLQKLVGLSEDMGLFHAPEMESESETEDELSSEDNFKLNKFKIKCLELQKDIDKAEAALQYEKRRKLRMEEEMQQLRRKAIELEDLYEIPII